jgi:hypothetical protein
MTGPRPDARPTVSLVRVFATASTPEGLLVKNLLEADGIPVFEKGEAEGPYRLGQVYLWVPAEYEVQARFLIADAQAAGRQTAGEDAESVGSEPFDL